MRKSPSLGVTLCTSNSSCTGAKCPINNESTWWGLYVIMYVNIKGIFIYLVRSMPWSSFFERSNSVRLLEAHDELFGRIISGPFYNFVQTIFPVSIVICTRSLVEVKIEKVVIRQHFLLHKLIHGVQTVHFYVLQISFRSDSFKWMQWSEVSIENKW